MTMTASQPRLRLHLTILDRDIDGLVGVHPRSIECRPGCSECCQQTFGVSEIEGQLLVEGLRAAPEAIRRGIVERARAYRRDTRAACPVLDSDGRCGLYGYRPRICRKYGVPLWHPERPHELRTCRLNFTEGVPAKLDAEAWVESQAEWARDWIRLREELGLGVQKNQSIAAWIISDIDCALELRTPLSFSR